MHGRGFSQRDRCLKEIISCGWAAGLQFPNASRPLPDSSRCDQVQVFAGYVDDMDNPLISLPINLNAALNLQEGVATVGFTAGTGRAYQKHDILSWYFCESETCLKKSMKNEFSNLIHYHQQHGTLSERQ